MVEILKNVEIPTIMLAVHGMWSFFTCLRFHESGVFATHAQFLKHEGSCILAIAKNGESSARLFYILEKFKMEKISQPREDSDTRRFLYQMQSFS